MLKLFVNVMHDLPGFHNRWNRSVGVQHPSIWIFIRKLKDEEHFCNVKIHAAERGDNPPSRKRRFRQLQERLSRLKQDYVAGIRSVNQYWAAVAHSVHHY